MELFNAPQDHFPLDHSSTATTKSNNNKSIEHKLKYTTTTNENDKHSHQIIKSHDFVNGGSRNNITSMDKVNGEQQQQQLLEDEISTTLTKKQRRRNPFFRFTKPNKNRNDSNHKKTTTTNLWRKRHPRSVEEGIRRTKNDKHIIIDNQEDMSIINNNEDDDDHPSVESKKQEALSSLLKDASETVVVGASLLSTQSTPPKYLTGRRFIARTIAGLIVALAEEATGLEVEVDARKGTHFWGKNIDSLKINFSRLGCKPLRMGGLDGVKESDDDALSLSESTGKLASRIVQYGRKKVRSIEEAFNDLDKDNSGALDEDELAEALSSMGATSLAASSSASASLASSYSSADNNVRIAAESSSNRNDATTNNTTASRYTTTTLETKSSLKSLAKRLVNLYDTNGDGVVDRQEYKNMVDDMAALRKAQLKRQKMRERERVERNENTWMKKLSNAMVDFATKQREELANNDNTEDGNKYTSRNSVNKDSISDGTELVKTMSKGDGSIVLTDLKLDMTRFVFGAIPLLKKITLGGPLILEPFTFTVNGSFNKEDIINSGLLDDGLRRLVARALQRRVRGIRDLLDNAVFYGRTWTTASKKAPIVEVPKLTSVEFDKKDRMIITGRARIRASPSQPFIEQSFKLRTKLGTRENGQYIRLKEPELAFIVECPKAFERHIVSISKTLINYTPVRPEPIFSYFPLVSPLKQTEADGFNLGEDNRIKSIFIKNGALRFEISAVLRPGRFLGNHYLAITFPNRAFIITMDRVKEAIRVARRNKLKIKNEASGKKRQHKTAEKRGGDFLSPFSPDKYITSLNEKFSFRERRKIRREDEVIKTEETSKKQSISKFFFRFVEGYLEASSNAEIEETHEERKERLTTAITEVFGSSDTN